MSTHYRVSEGAEALVGKRFDVLDQGKGWIELIDYMGNEQKIVMAARTSFEGGRAVMEDQKLLLYLFRHQHNTPADVPIPSPDLRCPHPILQRAKRPLHPTERRMLRQSRQNKQSAPELIQDPEGALSKISDYLEKGNRLYAELLDMGLTKELARGVVSVSNYTICVTSVKLNALRFIHLPQDPHAQYEIRVYADAIAEVIRQGFLRYSRLYDNADVRELLTELKRKSPHKTQELIQRLESALGI